MRLPIGPDFTKAQIAVEVAQGKTDWIKHFLLVMTSPHRLVGLVHLDEGGNEGPWYHGEPFTLQHVCTYASQIGFQPAQDGRGVTIGGPRLVMPFDGLTPLRRHRVIDYTGTTFLAQEPEDSNVRKLLIEQYTNIFDPPKIVKPVPGQMPAPPMNQ